jgi:hypothetical protein
LNLWLILFALAAIGVAMLSDATWRKRRYERALRERVESVDRFVDIGVVLYTVKANPNGKELLPGKPKMEIVGIRHVGGMLDTRSNPPRIVGPSRSPVTWYCSEDQEPVIVHDDADALGQLVYGSEGAGKTTALAMWHYFRWLENLGEKREGGQTAPTGKRLDLFRAELQRLYPSTWYRHRVAEDVIQFADGTRIRLKSTYQQSKAGGAPIQGFNWSWCGRDELQDQIDAHQDIESRGRSAPDGRYKQLATCTAKQSAAFRNLRDLILQSGIWVRRTLLIKHSPFISPEFLANKAKSMSRREYERRYEAIDLPPENATYHAWKRERNLVAIAPHREDCTADVLANLGGGYTMLAGHDPGVLFDVTVLLKAYRTRGGYEWVVVDEVTTQQTTTEQHVDVLLRRLREKWHCNLLDRHGVTTGPRVFVRADPYGNNDTKPDRACYTVFRNAGLRIEPAVYSKGGTTPGRVPKNEGIELVNTLLCNAAGVSRLFVARGENAQPVAPNLVQAIEESERDYAGRAETQAKDKNDLSHWPAALRYALWSLERPRLQALAGGRA